VITNGMLAAEAGRIVGAIAKTNPEPLRDSIKLPLLGENDFRLPATGSRVRLATIDRPRFTQWGEIEADVEGSFVVPPAGTTMLAVAHRHGKADSRPRIGFLTGWGEWRGAFCTTVSHDSHNLTVFGGNVRDMTIAANAVIAAGGGLAIARDGKVVALLPLPLSGLVSDAPLEETANAFRAIREAIDGIVDWSPPYLVFKACFGATLACNAGPHQTDRGIADVATRRVLETPVLGEV